MIHDTYVYFYFYNIYNLISQLECFLIFILIHTAACKDEFRQNLHLTADVHLFYNIYVEMMRSTSRRRLDLYEEFARLHVQ